MNTIQIALMAALSIAGSAQAQRLPPPPDPALLAEKPSAIAHVPSFPRLVSINEGLTPDDPLAPDLYRADPKLYTRVDINSSLGLQTTLTNPGYVDRMHFLDPGPRLAAGTPFGGRGYDFDVAARLTAPVDSTLSTFGTLGVSASARDPHAGRTTNIGASASVGATYKLSNSQTTTVEVPLGANARKALSGAADGVGARVRLGF